MSEWWTYRPSDFLMFSARSYGRLVESYNREMWPLQLVTVGAMVVIAWLTLRHPAGRHTRGVRFVLALAWLWVGWAFHWQRFAQIDTAAPYFAIAFFVEAALLLALSRTDPPLADGRIAASPGNRAGAGIFLAAALFYPAMAPLTGRPWGQAEVFGLMPEPTAMATLGVLLFGRPRYRLLLCIVPVLSAVIGASTAWLLWRA